MITLRERMRSQRAAAARPSASPGRLAVLVCGAILACCASLGSGCASASRELASASPPANASDAAGPPAVSPPRTRSAAADRGAWSRHSKAGRDHLALRRYREAEEEFVVAMDLAGDFEPRLQRERTSLANLERVAVRYPDDSRDLIRITRVILPIAARVRGSSDESVTFHLTALGRALVATDQFEEARGPLNRALEIVRAKRGDDSLRVAELYALRASLERASGNLDAAESDLVRALEIGQRVGGSEDPALAPMLAAQAQILAERGHSADAEAALLRASDLAAGVGGMREASVLNDLAVFYADNGRASEAESLALRALSLASSRGASPGEMAAILDTLGTALMRQEKYAEAEVHLARAYELAPHVTAPPFDEVREHYAQLLRANGRDAEADAVEAGRDPETETTPAQAGAPASPTAPPTSPESDAGAVEDIAQDVGE